MEEVADLYVNDFVMTILQTQYLRLRGRSVTLPVELLKPRPTTARRGLRPRHQE